MVDRAGADVFVLGAGLTGLSTAYHLTSRALGPAERIVLVEREQRVGGKACSDRRDGFTFDITGHWLHVREPRAKALLSHLFAPGDLTLVERRTGVWTMGAMLPYPFQANLHGLPLPVVHECLVGLFEAHTRAGELAPGASLEAFAERRFGRGIARHFFVPYNTKLWGVAPDRMSSSWTTRYIPVPDASQILAGALGMRQEGLGYNAQFSYPREPGIDALPQALARALADRDDVELRLGTDVEAIDAARARIKLAGESDWRSYRKVVSTMPLPELVDRVVDAPPGVRTARAALRWVRWRYLNVATRTRAPMAEHWVYVPEPELPFFRVGVFSNAAPAMAPHGCSALYVELTDRDHPPDLPTVFAALAGMGAITTPDDVLFADMHDIEYAYVVFDDDHPQATQTILQWLAAHGIRSCGRYGAWVYSSMEDALVDGMDAAAWVTA